MFCLGFCVVYKLNLVCLVARKSEFCKFARLQQGMSMCYLYYKGQGIIFLFQIIGHIHLHNGSQCVCKACAQTYEGVFHKRGSSPEVSVPAGYKL